MTPDTASERVALVMYHLMRGREMTTRRVAVMTGLRMSSAYRLMARISRMVPLYQEGAVWRLCEECDTAAPSEGELC